MGTYQCRRCEGGIPSEEGRYAVEIRSFARETDACKLSGSGSADVYAEAGFVRVIMNLVINGAEAIGTDMQGTVLVHTAVQNIDSEYIERTFTAGEIEPGRYVSLEVQDTGCGMDQSTVAEALPHSSVVSQIHRQIQMDRKS
jgi:signal transduction histidine kinase